MRGVKLLLAAVVFFFLSLPVLAEGGGFYYTIKEGDTLSEISRQFLGETLFYLLIAELNGIIDSDFILPGQKLLIPYRDSYCHRKLVLVETGDATFYNLESAGDITNGGELFDPDNKDTGASTTLPLGTVARVTNVANGKSVVVRINDTGGFTPYGIIIDLSEKAFSEIAPLEQGRIRVEIRILKCVID